MKPMMPLAALLALTLVACGDERAAAGAGDPPTSAPVGASDPPAAPVTDTGDTTAPMPDADSLDPADPRQARFDGVGPAAFGMTAAEVRAAWPGSLDGDPAGEGPACYHLYPAGQPDIASFALMFGDGRFVRYSVAGTDVTAPGGGRVGMDEARLGQLYGDGTERSGHKYVDGGEYLEIADPAGGESRLIFETGADDVVTDWRVGLPPHVGYVEGCA